MPLVPQITLKTFDKWAVNFVGPIITIGKHLGIGYIITMTDYLTIWAKAIPVKYCTPATAAKFLFENVVTRFGCPKFLISDQRTHFFNEMIEELAKEFQIQHIKTMQYHPQANGVVELFNKILENALTKVCNV